MKITKAELIELGACKDGLERFIAQTNNTDEPVEVSSLVGGKNLYSDLLWLAGKKLTKERIVRFACDCALINIEKIRLYTDKYEMISDFLSNPTGDTYAAYAAVRDAAVRDADVDRAAACAAACAAYAAYAYAVRAAAVRAARAADVAAAENRDKVNELLKELFA